MEKWNADVFAGYLAGLLDGEGCIEIQGTYSVRIRIANTVKPTLDAVCARLGFGRIIEYARPPKLNYQRLFCYEVSNVRDVERFFDVCGDYVHMKVARRDEALLICAEVRKRVKLTDQRNHEILAAIATGEVQNHIARRFGVSPQLVSRIKKGHTWKSVITARSARSLARYNPRADDQVFRLHGTPK